MEKKYLSHPKCQQETRIVDILLLALFNIALEVLLTNIISPGGGNQRNKWGEKEVINIYRCYKLFT